MKTIIDEDKIIVFLNKDRIKNVDLKEENLEEYFKIIFLNLNEKYNIELNGYYNIDVYKDNNYGIILEIESEDMDYYNYFNQIDMKINISNKTIFLYEIGYEFIDNSLLKDITCYKCLNKLYIKVKENIDNNKYSKILEYSNIIYGDKIDDILKYSEKVKI